MQFKEFNCRFLIALDTINPSLKHLVSGTGNRHPLLRSVLLRAVKEDINMDGYLVALEKWHNFVSDPN